MEIYEAIEKRRTVRGFIKGTTEEKLRKMIIAGTKAPSAGNRQPWEFIIIDDRKILDQIAEHKFQQNRTITGAGTTQEQADERAMVQKKIYQNASAVAVCHKAGHEQAVSAWVCIGYMSLAATAEGLGVVTSGFWREGKGRLSAVEKVLGIPEGYELATVMLVGVQEGKAPAKTLRPEFSWLHRNKFGSQPKS